ncbi:hypothetical protein R1sor_019293 [Riccia sorocarpa]|uniref:Uncharacterized protein n=1 Tax=Riccia sorocarpa TaxID=122646 RepID=A0ABD3ICP3_9MARC
MAAPPDREQTVPTDCNRNEKGEVDRLLATPQFLFQNLIASPSIPFRKTRIVSNSKPLSPVSALPMRSPVRIRSQKSPGSSILWTQNSSVLLSLRSIKVQVRRGGGLTSNTQYVFTQPAACESFGFTECGSADVDDEDIQPLHPLKEGRLPPPSLREKSRWKVSTDLLNSSRERRYALHPEQLPVVSLPSVMGATEFTREVFPDSASGGDSVLISSPSTVALPPDTLLGGVFGSESESDWVDSDVSENGSDWLDYADEICVEDLPRLGVVQVDKEFSSDPLEWQLADEFWPSHSTIYSHSTDFKGSKSIPIPEWFSDRSDEAAFRRWTHAAFLLEVADRLVAPALSRADAAHSGCDSKMHYSSVTAVSTMFDAVVNRAIFDVGEFTPVLE